jgi:hypothetical protein
MKKKEVKKLRLYRETLRQLKDSEVPTAKGGVKKPGAVALSCATLEQDMCCC